MLTSAALTAEVWLPEAYAGLVFIDGSVRRGGCFCSQEALYLPRAAAGHACRPGSAGGGCLMCLNDPPAAESLVHMSFSNLLFHSQDQLRIRKELVLRAVHLLSLSAKPSQNNIYVGIYPGVIICGNKYINPHDIQHKLYLLKKKKDIILAIGVLIID